MQYDDTRATLKGGLSPDCIQNEREGKHHHSSVILLTTLVFIWLTRSRKIGRSSEGPVIDRAAMSLTTKSVSRGKETHEALCSYRRARGAALVALVLAIAASATTSKTEKRWAVAARR